MNLHTLKSLAKLSGEEYLTSNYSHLGMRLIERLAWERNYSYLGMRHTNVCGLPEQPRIKITASFYFNSTERTGNETQPYIK